MSEKLALKKALFDELKSTNEEIQKMEKMKSSTHVYLPNVDAKLSILNSHKEFVQKLIDICVNRNKF